MFITSEALKKRIAALSNEIYKISNGAVSFEEYIALPHYGRICLRFNLNLQIFNLDDLDNYERTIYSVVRDEFIIDFMGDVYRTVGADYQHFDEILEKCSVRYQNEVLTDCQYAQEIRADGQYLLTQCGLAESLEVWEIQPEEEILLFVLGKENKQIATCFVDGTTVHVLEANKQLCEGLTKATQYAKQNGVSLARIFLKNQQTLS